MGKPRLLLINHYASTPSFPGPTRNFDLAAVLVKQGWEVTLVSCRFNHYLRRYLPNPPGSEKGVKLKWIWSASYRGNTLQRELNILLFSFLSFWSGLFVKADLVLTVTPPLESAWWGWLLARVKGVPFVLDVEDLWPDSLITMGFRNKAVIGWLRFLERFLYRRADHFLAVAAEMRDYLLKQGIPAERTSLIPLGANMTEPTGNRRQIRQQYGWEDHQTVAVYVGAHGPANALETLIKAAQLLEGKCPVKIVLFGDGSDKPRLQAIADNLRLKNLVLENPVPPQKVPEILEAADIGIASLKNTETFKTVRPNKIYEYMAAGLPVVCCIEGEAGDLIGKAESGLCVTPEDYHGLASALQKLAADAFLRREYGNKGREFVKREGDREKLGMELDTILKKVIAG